MSPRVKPAPQRIIFAAPAENASGQELYDPVAAGLGDLVQVLLAQQEQIKIVERQRFDALAREQVLALQGLTGDQYAIQAGKLLQADTVLICRLFLVQDKLTVSVRALDIASAQVVAADQITLRPEDVMEASLQLARKLAAQLKLPLPQIDISQYDKSPLAGLHFAKALSHYYAGDLDSAIMQFMRAIDLDPDYVETHFWCGQCYWRQNEFGHAVIEWEKYLQRCPRGRYSETVRKVLAEAKAKAQAATPPGQALGPKPTPQGS